jgi:hypothetical protein
MGTDQWGRVQFLDSEPDLLLGLGAVMDNFEASHAREAAGDTGRAFCGSFSFAASPAVCPSVSSLEGEMCMYVDYI